MTTAPTHDATIATPGDLPGKLTREQFLNVFQALAGQFEHSQQEASSAERAFLGEMAALREVALRDPFAESPLDQAHPLRNLLQERIREIQRVFSHWDDEIARRTVHTDFKKRFGDSLLVFVYGKVKAGKSSLGNYIAWGETEPTTRCKAEHSRQPVFFVEKSEGLTEDISDASIRQAQQFKVGASETTTAIQGFTLPGLTWVDSPGLHSKNSQNGNLSQQYVDAADMILYLTNSSAPCKRSDILELKELGRKEHNLAVLITGSDTVDEDIDEHGEMTQVLRMKSDKDRQDQLNYVCESLKSQGDDGTSAVGNKIDETLRRAKVHSVSVSYAQLHPDAEGMSHSGVGQMLHEVATLASGAGVKAKLLQPLKNMLSFLDLIGTRHLPEISTCIDRVALAVAETKSQARADAQHHLDGIRINMNAEIDTLLTQYSNDSEGFQRAVNTSFNKWLGQARDATGEAYAASLGTGLIRSIDSAIGGIPAFAPVTKRFERKSSLNAKRGAALGTVLGGISLFFPVGAVAAAVTGLVISAVGSYAGKKAGELLDDTEAVEVVIGDNAHEVGSVVREKVHAQFTSNTGQLLASMDDFCFALLQDWIAGLQAQIGKVDIRITHLRTDLERRMQIQ